MKSLRRLEIEYKMSNTPASDSISLSLKEATALVTFLQHEWIGYGNEGIEVNEILNKLQRFVYSAQASKSQASRKVSL